MNDNDEKQTTGNVDSRIGELDAKGTPFDPIRHIYKRHPKRDTWMPRGGRKRATGETPAAESTGETSAPSNPPPPDLGPAPSFEDMDAIADAAKPETPDSTDGTATPPLLNGDAECSPEAAARVAAKALYTATGIAARDMKAATPPATEDKALQETLGAYFRYRGLRVAGGIALVVGVLAYFLRPELCEAIGKAWKSAMEKRRAQAEPKPVEAAAPPQTVTLVERDPFA